MGQKNSKFLFFSITDLASNEGNKRKGNTVTGQYWFPQNLSPDNNTGSNFKPVFHFLGKIWRFLAKKLGKFWFFLD
jgi:hypothetical protein